MGVNTVAAIVRARVIVIVPDAASSHHAPPGIERGIGITTVTQHITAILP